MAELVKLYKYQPINNYSISGLLNGTFFYANPTRFNDPLEFQLGPDVCTTEYADKIRKEHGLGRKVSYEEIKSKLQDEVRRQIKDFAVASLSKRDNCPLMWGHYADNHQGMRLEFEADVRGFPGDVSYSKERPIFSDCDTKFWSEGGVGQVLVNKHQDWAYEEEFRLLIVDGERTSEYPKGFQLVSIAFGLRTSELDSSLVKKILKGRKVVYQRVVLNTQNQFSLEPDS